MMKTKSTSQKEFPKFLKFIQVLNYASVVFSVLFFALYTFLPSNNEMLIIEGREALNKNLAGFLWLILAAVYAVVTYYIRLRSKYAPTLFAVGVLISFPIGELLYYYMNDPLNIFERAIFYAIDLALIAYIARNKRVRAIFDR